MPATALNTVRIGAVKELRIHLCQSSAGSAHLRSYLAKNYTLLKSKHPNLPILIREAHGMEARVFARYDRGEERKMMLENLDQDRIASKLEEVLN